MGLLNKFRKEKGKRDYKAEILENLSDLLNTKRGYGSYPRDLGLDSYTYLGSDRKIVVKIIEDIKKCFEKYEKRLKNVEIVHKPSENRFNHSFIIKCKINEDPHVFCLSFHQQRNKFSIEDKE